MAQTPQPDWFLGLLAAGMYGLAATWNEWWPYTILDIDDLEKVQPAIYSFIAGVIGATVYALRGFAEAVGPEQPKNPRRRYDPNWTWWYITHPVLGGFVGLFTFAIFRAGVGTLDSQKNDGTSNTGFFAIAFLAGLASKGALQWMTERAGSLFSGEGEGDGDGGHIEEEESG